MKAQKRVDRQAPLRLHRVHQPAPVAGPLQHAVSRVPALRV
jgi:hypothetical protein